MVNLTDTSGYIEHTYRYDAFGNEREPASSDNNPFRYCGEYYDGETGSYYLRARYYDPVIGRFTQEDPHWTNINRVYEDTLNQSTYLLQPQITAIMQSGNLYVYCGDNPVGNSDPNGYAFETVFDVVTLGFSVAEVIANPYDPMVWAGLVGDTIDLIPFVTGVGETVRGLRFIDKAGNVLELSNAVDFTDDVVDTLNSVERIDGITKSSSYAGIKIHSGYKKGAGFAVDAKEYTGRAGIRPDYYDKQVIYELKPFNPRAAKSGVKQLKKYNDALGGKNTMRLEFY